MGSARGLPPSLPLPTSLPSFLTRLGEEDIRQAQRGHVRYTVASEGYIINVTSAFILGVPL